MGLIGHMALGLWQIRLPPCATAGLTVRYPSIRPVERRIQAICVEDFWASQTDLTYGVQLVVLGLATLVAWALHVNYLVSISCGYCLPIIPGSPISRHHRVVVFSH